MMSPETRLHLVEQEVDRFLEDDREEWREAVHVDRLRRILFDTGVS